MDSPACFFRLLDLPKEIRLHIYHYAFEDIVSNALYIRKFDADPRWRLCYNPQARIPGLLLVSRAVYEESLPVLHQIARHNPPRIVIDYWGAALHARIMQPEEIEARRGFHVRDLETIRPMLRAVESLNVEIKAIHEDVFCVPLVHWIAAVLNNRSTLLRSLDVGIHVECGLGGTRERKGVVHELSTIQTKDSVALWSLRRKRRDDAQGPPMGSALDLDAEADAMPHVSEGRAWRALCFARSHYFVNVLVSENEVLVDPSKQWSVRVYCALSELWEDWTSSTQEPELQL